MTKDQGISELKKVFNINAIYAYSVFLHADKTQLIGDASRIIADKPKPFVKWVGGKRQLLSQFHAINLYPPEKFDPSKGRYFEPFVGGGAVFFDLLPEAANLSDLNTASRFIYLNRTCFNGMYRVNSKGGFNVPFGKYTNPLICDENNLRKASKALKNVEIKKQYYKEVLKKAKKGDFVYFDPPYYPISKTASFTSYTSEAFLDKEQTELRDTFVELHKRGCFVMLSNSDTPFINKIYSELKGLRVTKVQAGRAINSDASKRGKITEVLVTNY